VPADKPGPKVQRRLAAFFCADVAGYARLMNADEGGTLRLLTAHREITDREIEQHGGRIANTAGDSILAEFPSAVDALQCALNIQERIASVNSEIPEERRVSFRIGLHVGEAMVRDGDLFGDGVNIAARMQALAAPGTVCLSGAAHEFVHRALPLRFESLGPQQVKNIDTAIPAYLARPSAENKSRPLHPFHRRRETYLARRFNDLFVRAMEEITGREGLIVLCAPILASISDAPGLDEAGLAKRLNSDRASVRRAVAKLVARGLVIKSANATSGRVQVLHLTPAGAEMHQRFRPLVNAMLDRIMSPLSDQERDLLQELLARVIAANQAKAAPEPKR
jgi:class 3 adenylate cyclase/DNA-binding MarR family transcriptional regulator